MLCSYLKSIQKWIPINISTTFDRFGQYHKFKDGLVEATEWQIMLKSSQYF